MAEKGAQVQRPLWASTSTKNPNYRDVLYAEELIGPHTVDTAPPATIEALKDHGQVRASLEEGLDEAPALLERLKEFNISYDDATQKLQDDGVEAFAKSFVDLLKTLENKREPIVSRQVNPLALDLDDYQSRRRRAPESLGSGQGRQRIWDADGTVWVADPDQAAQTPDLTNRLGWLNIGQEMLAEADNLAAFAAEIKAAGFQEVVLLGMGGSSLAPEVFMRTFGSPSPSQEGWGGGSLPLTVLDSTNPVQVAAVAASLADPAKTLFLVSSKSGGTIEMLSFFKYFYHLVSQAKENPGENFVALTDPGSGLEKLAQEKKFRQIFSTPPDVGGRYSALTYFGLVPAALIGVNVPQACCAGPTPWPRPAAIAHFSTPVCNWARPWASWPWLGRDKITFFVSPKIAAFGVWVEQLIAESTGKQGTGILPVVDEAIAEPAFL